jgi:hypothetical protein
MYLVSYKKGLTLLYYRRNTMQLKLPGRPSDRSRASFNYYNFSDKCSRFIGLSLLHHTKSRKVIVQIPFYHAIL